MLQPTSERFAISRSNLVTMGHKSDQKPTGRAAPAAPNAGRRTYPDDVGRPDALQGPEK